MLTEGSCRNGHDLSVLGRYPRSSGGSCVACTRKRTAQRHQKIRATLEGIEAERVRSLAKYHRRKAEHVDDRRAYRHSVHGRAVRDRWNASVDGQVSRLKAQLNYRIKVNTIRVSELEALLNAST